MHTCTCSHVDTPSQEKEVRDSLSEVLGTVEVKRKEVTDLLAMMDSLEELRDVRRDAGRRRGERKGGDVVYSKWECQVEDQEGFF